jgi:DNA-binding LacI/PurR family transcriptional regulator
MGQQKLEALQTRFSCMSRPATLAQIARAAGVSLGTASNAFNRPDAVRPEVRSAVLAAAEKLGYAGPDPVGRMLMGGKANVIAVLPPGDMSVSTAFQSPFFREFMLGISQVCDDHGASLVVLPGSTDRKAWAITNAVVDGFILGHSDEVALVAGRRRKVPCVVMDMDAGPDVPTVSIDARLGACKAAEHLLSFGHRNFAIISVARRPRPHVLHRLSDVSRLSAGYQLDEEKLAGYREALLAASVPLDSVLVGEVYPHPPWRTDGAAAILDAAPGTTAVLAMSDRNATAMLEAASARGLEVPGKVSVVGFDDAPEAAISSPPLTTVAQPLVEKGRCAARVLFGEAVPLRTVLPVELVVRASSGPTHQSPKAIQPKRFRAE